MEDDIKRYVHALLESQAKFVDGGEKIINSMVSLTDRLDRWIHVAESVTDQMERYADLSKELVETNRLMLKALADTQAAINENTSRLDSFIGKLESYFGSGTGLEYEN
jgi:ABC-type transporter Mla subunit MlaD